MQIGKYIHTIRLLKGISLYRLSRDTGVSFSNIHYIENDKKSPTFATVEKLLSALDAEIKIVTKKRDDH